MSSSLWTPTLYQLFLPSQGWPDRHVSLWEYPTMPQQGGRDAIVIEALAEWWGWRASGRYYGFLDRWLSVFVAFDVDDLSPTPYPGDDFPFAFNRDMTPSHYVDAIYTTDLTTDLHPDVLSLADGTTHQLVDVQDFQGAYDDGLCGQAWYDGARQEAERVIEEVRTGRFIDMLREVAPFPDMSTRTNPAVLTDLDPDEVGFRHHPDFP